MFYLNQPKAFRVMKSWHDWTKSLPCPFLPTKKGFDKKYYLHEESLRSLSYLTSLLGFSKATKLKLVPSLLKIVYKILPWNVIYNYFWLLVHLGKASYIVKVYGCHGESPVFILLIFSTSTKCNSNGAFCKPSSNYCAPKFERFNHKRAQKPSLK